MEGVLTSQGEKRTGSVQREDGEQTVHPDVHESRAGSRRGFYLKTAFHFSVRSRE
jgi:hypothetical protein